jgi:hypothetical protein
LESGRSARTLMVVLCAVSRRGVPTLKKNMDKMGKIYRT